MKKLFLLIWILLFAFACVATNKPLEKKPNILVDPFVQNWMNKPAALSSEKIAILVVSKEPLSQYGFLRRLKTYYYTGHVNRAELKLLLQDNKILRISGGAQKPH